MSIITHLARRRSTALAGVALAAATAFGSVAAGSVSADTAPPAADSSSAAAAPCFKEYEFSRMGNTLYATGHMFCDDAVLPVGVKIQMWYSDQWYSGWITVASGSGVAKEPCNLSWPETFRHSVTKQQITC